MKQPSRVARTGTAVPTGMAVDVDVAIVGTGFSGLGMAVQLQQRTHHSFVLFEKGPALGGTWRDNDYPGCACDVPSHLYSFSFAPNPRWSRMYAPQEEILAYLRRVADEHRLHPHIRLNAELATAELDERAGCWRLELRGGEKLTARHLVLGVGALSRPAYPTLRGLERFRGKSFHSARWDHSFELPGKRVAVVGTGASAVQFVPKIAPEVERLDLYQRTPPWVIPRDDRAVSPREQRLFGLLPVTQRLYRYFIYWSMELRALGFVVDPKIMRIAADMGRKHIHAQLRDERLRALVTPSYTPGCKRVLMSDDYYPALERPNVQVIGDAIAEVTARGIVTEGGVERAVDAIIFGTGFHVTDMITPMHIRGRGGVDLNDAWKDRIEAYLGTTVAGFPNLYVMTGPNTGLGHNSMVFMIEAQIDHVIACLKAIRRRGATLAEVRAPAQRAFNDKLAPRLDHAVWSSGCKSWYIDAHGRNSTTWPGFTFEFWLRTRRLVARDYIYG